MAITKVTGAGMSDAINNAMDANTAKVTNYNQHKGDIEALGIAASSITGALPAIDGSALTGIETVTKSATAPSSPTAGDMWFNTSASAVSGIASKCMGSYSGTEWLQMSNKFSASGGTESTVGNYKYHTFTSSGTFTADASGDVDILIVGGGGGTTPYGGGGGGGAVFEAISYSVSPASYTVVIGAGGLGVAGSCASYNCIGNTGGTSTGFGVSITGGGGGKQSDAGGSTTRGANGGGGGSRSGGDYGTKPSVPFGVAYGGFDGGSGQNNSAYPGGGGAGANGHGASPPSNSSPGGNGGAGKVSNIPSSSTYFGGGGGGGTHASSAGGTGGIGGGGRGSSNTANNSANGTANTGGGGGGGGEGNTSSQRNGGSGIVIVRYEA